MAVKDLNKIFPKEDSLLTKPRPYVNHSVEFKHPYSVKKRMEVLEKSGMNVFNFPAEMITGVDFLSDSGTTTMTNKQWASLHLGDESYGSNKGYFQLKKQVQKIFGKEFFNDPNKQKPNAFIFHQGRSCENALFSIIGRLGTGLIIPSNGHFDTTEANIMANKIQALNLFSKQLKDPLSNYHFKGDMDVDKLKDFLKKSHKKIPMGFLTITNNTGGGQPVSMNNVQQVSALMHKYDLPLFFDACRFSENAWFIKKYDKNYRNKSIKEIVKKMFTYVDGFTISFKKDGLVNMGGGLFIKEDGYFQKKYPQIADQIINLQILTEGHPTYGGMSGRDIMALVEGLKTVVELQYLDYRINQVKTFCKSLVDKGIPVLTPPGGHAVYLDMNKFFEDTDKKPGDFGGIAFTALLLGLYGHRACELGNFAFGTYNSKTKKETFPEVNFVRFAIPRLRYEQQDLEAAAESIKVLYDYRKQIPSVKAIYGKELSLRHFKAKFKFK